MIQDQAMLQELILEWHSVRKTQSFIQINIVSSFARGGILLQPFPNNCYALLLPFGFSVLEHALQQLRDEGVFACRSSQLKKLMEASVPALSWCDFSAVDKGRDTRNKLTHEQIVPPHTDTFAALDAVERELVEWKILPGPVRYEHSVSMSRAT